MWTFSISHAPKDVAFSATSFPLADAHGDITAIADQAGEVSSRQTYDPWGAQLSGPALEMGYLGSQERRTDPLSDLIQMGARPYSPTLGRFITEDSVYGHIGVGTSFDRYAYVWDNPVNLYDLDGRDVCVPTPFGKACAEDAAEDVGNAADDAVDTAGNIINAGREQVSIAQEYWVNSDSWLAPFAGSAVSIVDLAINPDRLDYYLKSNDLPQKQQLADCYNGGHPARTIGGIVGGTGGFGAGFASARADLGVRAVGVGSVSGGVGAAAGGTIGTLGGCAFGVIGRLAP